MSGPVVGVLALQGDVREHLAALERVGARACGVRRTTELERCDAVVLPGGESTTIARLARRFEVLEPLRGLLREGLPAFGTCAGMVLLADRVLDGERDQETIGGLDVTVRRNAFGRQVASFEAPVPFPALGEDPFHALFIRAPWVEEVAADVEVLARVPQGAGEGEAVGRIVAVRQRAVLATSFHPEVGDDDRLHRYFVDQIVQSRPEGDR